MHRGGGRGLEVLLILPGGPYWKKRDVGAWQIPKGGIEEGEMPEEAALREEGERGQQAQARQPRGLEDPVEDIARPGAARPREEGDREQQEEAGDRDEAPEPVRADLLLKRHC